MRFFTLLCIASFIVNGVFSKPDCKVKLQQCENKKPTPRRQVCGTDNQTYPNRCALLRVQCAQNNLLEVKHRGKCKEKQPCWMDQGKKLTNTRGNAKDANKNANGFTPECSADGTYAPIQCHKSLGYCWCVTPNGRNIPGTTVLNKKPECPKRGRKGPSSKNNSEDGKNSSKKGCDPIDRGIFTKNLVRIFKTEYNREVSSVRLFSAPDNETGLSLDAKAVGWKFSKLDKDRNHTLTKNEYKDLRKLVKKVVRPRRCSRAFIRLCDVDQNSIITKPEWTSCLSIDSDNNHSNHNNNNNNENNNNDDNTNGNQEQVRTTTEESTGEEDDQSEIEEVEAHDPRDPASILEESVLPLNEHNANEDDDDNDGEAQDCLSERKSAMEEYSHGNMGLFIPDCTPEGLYKKVQCFLSTGYCWCVSEDSGRTIPGTSSKNSHPNCDNIRSLPPPMKGCPDEQKSAFIKDLMEFFRQNMSNANIDASVSAKEDQRSNEYAASLGFYGLDSNKNKLLDRKEWKVFRSMMATNNTLRRCGRKLPRYCDSNHDQEITINEWIQCLTVQTPANLVQTPSSSNPPRRRGPNPESYLKDEED
ncbi:SPARC-related modular calcium-binding protein 2 isoform X2 [Planococcus citri]|uniref:SPARC-related modular calcium-binding protein 2 isoform X2 n=1 Tax=Planococcus citri TaxID=170843 RepID=UPI0031F9886D